jgi:glycosyltransferase involved in cell wall biosynthesis
MTSARYVNRLTRLRKPRLDVETVVSLSTADIGGGAERVAWSLHKGLQAQDKGSWLLVGDKKSDDPHVLPFWGSPFFDYRPFDDPLLQASLDEARRRDQSLGIDDFHFPYSSHVAELTGEPPEIIVCHNLHGGFFDLRALSQLSAQLPTVLVLHDLWLATGHCAQPIDCPRWQTGCGACPDLKRDPSILADGTHYNWLRKRDIFRSSSFWVSCPSKWIAEQASRSILAPAIRDIRVIPYPIDLKVFHPGSVEDERIGLDLPVDAFIAVFLMNHGPGAAYKDFPTLMDAARSIGAMDVQRRTMFIGLGDDAPPVVVGNAEIRFVPFQPSEQVASYLRAADVYVQSSRMETYGLGIAEALACGAAVIATDVGGTAEVLGQGEIGRLIPRGDSATLTVALLDLLEHPERIVELGHRGAEYARSHWDATRVTTEYLDWFEEIAAEFAAGLAPGHVGHSP